MLSAENLSRLLGINTTVDWLQSFLFFYIFIIFSYFSLTLIPISPSYIHLF